MAYNDFVASALIKETFEPEELEELVRAALGSNAKIKDFKSIGLNSFRFKVFPNGTTHRMVGSLRMRVTSSEKTHVEVKGEILYCYLSISMLVNIIGLVFFPIIIGNSFLIKSSFKRAQDYADELINQLRMSM